MEAKEIRNKYPNKIPIVIRKSEDIHIDKIKYLVPKNLTCGQFMFIIRKRLKLKEHESIFMMFNSIMLNSSALLSEYDNTLSNNEYMYIDITRENTFGSTTF